MFVVSQGIYNHLVIHNDLILLMDLLALNTSPGCVEIFTLQNKPKISYIHVLSSEFAPESCKS